MKFGLTLLLSVFVFPIIHTKADDWPQWRGPGRDAKSAESGLLQSWPEGGPPVVWKIENAGVGYSAVAVSKGKIFTMGDLDGVEHILCFKEEDGSLIWAVQPEPVAAVLDKEVSERFSNFDKNSDGKLSEEEALAGLGPRAFESDGDSGGDLAEVAKTRAAGFLKLYDKDGDGQLGPAEIPGVLGKEVTRVDVPSGGRREARSVAENRVAITLKALDQDGDGSISQKESKGTVLSGNFRNADVAKEGEKNGDGKLTAEEMTDYFSKKETGRDGVITGEELAGYFQKNHPGRDGVLDQADLKRSIGGYRNGQGDGPRGTPAVDGNRLYTEGGNGDVTCLDTETGKTIWHKNLVTDFGGKRPGWGYSESPLLVGNLVFVTPGGSEGTMLALNKTTGEQVWRSSGISEAAHYSSPVVAEIAGQKQIVQFGRESVFGLSFDDGNFLWKYSGAANGTANCATPIVAGDHVLSSSAYGTGGGLVKVSGEGESQKAEELWFDKSFANHHGGIVKVDDHVYGFGGNSLLCVNFLTGEIAWQEKSVGKGSLICADGQLYCLGERHEVALVKATPKEYVENGRFSIETQGRPSWAHPVVANARFYLRDQNTLTAYDVKAK